MTRFDQKRKVARMTHIATVLDGTDIGRTTTYSNICFQRKPGGSVNALTRNAMIQHVVAVHKIKFFWEVPISKYRNFDMIASVRQFEGAMRDIQKMQLR